MRLHLIAVALAALAGTACTKKTTGNITLTGKVSQLSSTGDASALEGATVRGGCDLDGDGVLQGDEEKSVTTGEGGTYSLTLGTLAGKSVSVRFSDSGTNTVVRSVAAVDGDQAAAFDVTLVQIEELKCSAGRCVSPDRALKIDGLAAGLEVRGRTFNPVTEAFAMPGGFVDADGKLLVSGVFATIEVEDENGERVEKLGAPATLRMRLPRETWGEVVDIAPGDDRIQVPMYAFDEAKGAFVREGEGYLEDSAGSPIPEARLPAIRSGSFSGAVFSRSQASHFSTWNVDWPVNTQTCIGGLLLKEDGSPAVGFTVEVEGLTYNGASPAKQSDANGRYCVPVMRSEKPGEDVGRVGPGNNVPGEVQRVAVLVRSATDAWDLGERVTPNVDGCACDESRSDTLSPANRLVPRTATVTGTVSASDGGIPAPGVGVSVSSVFALPPNPPACSDCTDFAQVQPDGTFSLKAQALSTIRVRALAARNTDAGTELEEAVATVRMPPIAPLSLRLRPTTRFQQLAMTVSGAGVIDWSPSAPVTTVMVLRGGALLWTVTGTEIFPPVTVGQVPPGASQLAPFTGTLASGDMVTVVGNFVDDEGVTNQLSATFPVP